MAATGTIALNANSLTVTGSGTKFTTEAQVGGALVTYIGNVPYTFVVGAINSDTSITLTANYQGSNVSGQSFSLIDRGAYTAITAELGSRTAQAIRGLNYDKANWQQILTGSGNVTVNVPDGSQFTGPSWLSLADSLSNINSSLGKKANADDVTSALGKKLDTSGGIVSYIAFSADGNTRIRYALSSSVRYLVFDQATLYPTSGYRTSRGASGIAGSNSFNYYWTGSVLEAWIDSTQVGNVSLASVSDKGLKEEITYKDRGNSLSEVKSWKPATFRMKKRGVIAQSDIKLGFIANDLAVTSPECVTGEGLPDDYDIEKDPNNSNAYQLDQVAMIAKLTMAVQELAAKVEALEKK